MKPCGQNLIVVQQNLADYRVGFYRRLSQVWAGEILLLCGDTSFANGQVNAEETPVASRRLSNTFLFQRQILFQSGEWHLRLSDAIYVGECNYRTLSTWLVLVLRRLLGRRTVLWGHVRGKRKWTILLRAMMLSMTDGFICYTKTQKSELVAAGYRRPTWVASNACMSASDMTPSVSSIGGVRNLLFVGRLAKDKKPRLLLDAFSQAINLGLLPVTIQLVFVGSGPEHRSLVSYAETAGIGNRVQFLGQIAEIGRLRILYAEALATVSPGFVGLSALQSFGFGVPMIVARSETHSPEIEACVEDFNTIYFTSNDPSALRDAIVQLFAEKQRWINSRSEISEHARNTYSFETMATGFSEMAEFFAASQTPFTFA